MSLVNEALKNALIRLAHQVIAEVGVWRASGKLVLRREQYTLRPDFSLWYSGDPTIMNNLELQTFEEDEWPWKDLEMFLSERILNLTEYSDVVGIIQESKRDEGLARSFVWRIAYETATTNSPEVDRHVTTLIGDITASAQKYHIKIFVSGITLTESVIRVSDSLLFRRPTHEDLQEKVRSDRVHYAHAMRLGRIHFSCIVESQLLASRPIDEQIHVDRLITALRLFRLGSVWTARYDYHAESFSSFSNGSFGSATRVTRLNYALTPADAPQLAKMLNVIMPLLPSQYEPAAGEVDFLSTALHWYSEALLAGGPIEGVVAWAVACLEALFLGDNPSTEISYRLAQRVIALLRCFGWLPLEMRVSLRTAYDVRSKYVHGAVSKKRSQEDLLALFRKVADYARVSCLVWTQMRHTRKRKDALTALEDALVDCDSQLQLQRWCNPIDFATKPW